MKATTSVWFAILAAAVAAVPARGAESGEFRVDARASYGGRVGTGVEWVGEADGSALRQWDTTVLPDGWTTLESGGSAAEVCVLNGPDVAGGRVDSDETWGADRVHVVRDDVVVGEGAVLTLERGAVVKFTAGARIVVEEGGDDLESERDYRVLAKKTLSDPDWTDVTDLDDRSAYHFFTVEVRPVE